MSWSPLPVESQNGPIVLYTLVYNQVSDSRGVSINSTTTQTLIDGLNPDTGYEVSVRAWTEAGEGPLSEAVKHETGGE